MEFGDQEKKRKSIGFSLSAADEKIKLIDIFSDDDSDFLVASHSSNSLQDNVEKDYGQLRLPSLGVESSRPSLAWDAAFCNSSGFLDQHELSIINQGFKNQESKSSTHKKVDCSSGSNYKKSSRKEGPVFSPNPANALCRLRNSLNMKPNKKDLVGKNDAKMEKTHTAPNSARFSYSSPRSCPSHLKRMAQARNSEMSRIWTRCSERTKLVPNSPSLSPGFRSKTGYDNEPIIMDYNDAKEAPKSLQETRDIFFSAAEFRPSGIRPPSPKFGFFDEKTPLISLGEPKTRSNTPRKVEMQGTSPFDAKAHEFGCSRTDTPASSACEKLKRNIKRSKAAHVNPRNATNIKETCCSIKKKSEDASRKLSKYDPFLSQENGKKKACTDSRDRHGKLCRYFEAIDLNQDNRQQSSLSSNKNRTPLTEKAPSICDYSNTNLIWFETK